MYTFRYYLFINIGGGKLFNCASKDENVFVFCQKQVVKHFWISKHGHDHKISNWISMHFLDPRRALRMKLSTFISMLIAVTQSFDIWHNIKKRLDGHNYKDFILHSLVALGSLPKRDKILLGLVTLAREPGNENMREKEKTLIWRKKRKPGKMTHMFP